MSNLNALVKQLKENTEKVKIALAKNVNATNNAINASTPAAAAPFVNAGVAAANNIQGLAVQNQKLAENINIPQNSPLVQGPAQAAMEAGKNNANAANAIAAQAAAANPQGNAAANSAVNAANKSTNAALAGNTPEANKQANIAANAAVNAVSNASPAAKKIANTIKKNIMNNPRRKTINTNANRGKVAANILNTKFNNGYLNKVGTAANFERAYTNLMKNTNISNNQKNVIKRAYFSYMLNQAGGKRRPDLTNNLTNLSTFNNYKGKYST